MRCGWAPLRSCAGRTRGSCRSGWLPSCWLPAQGATPAQQHVWLAQNELLHRFCRRASPSYSRAPPGDLVKLPPLLHTTLTCGGGGTQGQGHEGWGQQRSAVHLAGEGPPALLLASPPSSAAGSTRGIRAARSLLGLPRPPKANPSPPACPGPLTTRATEEASRDQADTLCSAELSAA